MKRWITIILTICLVLSMSACGGETKGQGTDESGTKTSAKETGSAAVSQSAEEVKTEEVNDTAQENAQDGTLKFDTVDIHGDRVTDEVMKDAKLVLINLWEPWCGPCVREMPDLEKIYEKYKDQGLLILGVYATFDMDEDAKDVIASVGTTYPILKADQSLLALEQDYVPATFLFDGEGRLISSEPIAGSRSYEVWEEIVLYYLPE